MKHGKSFEHKFMFRMKWLDYIAKERFCRIEHRKLALDFRNQIVKRIQWEKVVGLLLPATCRQLNDEFYIAK